jgi:sterol carrier protein 2
MTRKAAKEAFAKADLTPNDMKVVELHDCFAPNELLLYDALGLCEEGEAAQLIESKNNT